MALEGENQYHSHLPSGRGEAAKYWVGSIWIDAFKCFWIDRNRVG